MLAGGAQAGGINNRVDGGGAVESSGVGAGVRGGAVGVMGGRNLKPGRSKGVAGGWGKGEGVGGPGLVGVVRVGVVGQTMTSAACCLGAGDGLLSMLSGCWIVTRSASSWSISQTWLMDPVLCHRERPGTDLDHMCCSTTLQRLMKNWVVPPLLWTPKVYSGMVCAITRMIPHRCTTGPT